MAMTDYPYDSSFLEPMPGYPINASCSVYKDYPASDITSVSDDTKWELLKNASDIYFNYTG